MQSDGSGQVYLEGWIQLVKAVVGISAVHAVVVIKCSETLHSIISVIFPPYKALRVLDCTHHHVVVLYHQLLGFYPHHASENLVQELT